MIQQALCTSFKREVLAGVHQAADVYLIALYSSAADLNAATAAYTATGEVAAGGGYTAGGQALAGFVTGQSGTSAWIDWTVDPAWANATITARGALIYNSSRGNKAVAVLDFGSDIISTVGPFTVTLPAATASEAIIGFD